MEYPRSNAHEDMKFKQKKAPDCMNIRSRASCGTSCCSIRADPLPYKESDELSKYAFSFYSLPPEPLPGPPAPSSPARTVRPHAGIPGPPSIDCTNAASSIACFGLLPLGAAKLSKEVDGVSSLAADSIILSCHHSGEHSSSLIIPGIWCMVEVRN